MPSDADPVRPHSQRWLALVILTLGLVGAGIAVALLAAPRDDPAVDAKGAARASDLEAASARAPASLPTSGRAEVTAPREHATPQAPTPVPATAASTTVRGRCVDERGAPLPDVIARVFAAANTITTTRSDADGRFAVTFPSATSAPELCLQARGRNLRRAAPWRDPVALTQGGEFDLGDVSLPATAQVQVALQDPTGTPTPVTGVLLAECRTPFADTLGGSCPPVRCELQDADRASIPGLAHGTWRFTIRAQGLIATSVDAVIRDAPVDVALVVTPIPPLTGSVCDASGAGIAGVAVRAYVFENGVPESPEVLRMLTGASPQTPAAGVAKTDAAGRFTLPLTAANGLDTGILLLTRDTTRRYAPGHLRARVGATDLRLTLERARSLVVRVVTGSDAQPVTGASVGFAEADGEGLAFGTEQRTVRGQVRFDQLADQPVQLLVRGPAGQPLRGARATATPTVRDDRGASGDPDVVVRLDPAPVAHIAVQCGDAAVAGSRVEVLTPRQREPHWSDEPFDPASLVGSPGDAPELLGAATTAADGIAPVPLLRDAARALVRVVGPGHAPYLGAFDPTQPTSASAPHRVQVVRGGTVRATLVGHKPTQAIALGLVPSGDGRGIYPLGFDQPAVAADGTVTFTHVPAGTWDLVVARHGNLMFPFEQEVAPRAMRLAMVAVGDGESAQMSLPAARAAPSRIEAPVTAGGRPLPDGERVTLWRLLSNGNKQPLVVLELRAGKLTHGNLFPGTYRLSAVRETIAAEFTVASGDVWRHDLDLR